MKQLNQKSIITITFIVILFTNQPVYAQWDALTYIPFIQTSNPFTAGVGIGQFPSAASFLSALHVNTNYTAPTTNFLPGEVFRTNCPDISTYWRMERADVEYGVLFNLNGGDDYPTGTATGSHFYLQASGGDIRFNTGGAIKRMRILGNNGFVGIGEYSTFYPTNILHMHIPSLDDEPPHDVYEQFTNSSTLSGPQNPTDGFRVGIRYNTATNLTDAELVQRQNSQIRFFTDIDNFVGTSSTFNTSPADRLRIDREVRVVPGGGPLNGTFYLTRVAITEGGPNNAGVQDWNAANATPISLLHLGQAWSYNTGGHRPWMDVGTFYCAGTDMLYTGLKEESHLNTPGLWTDHMDAIIGWGDNINAPDGADNLRIVFSARQLASSGDAGNVNALEVARFSPQARMGIGNFTVPAFGNGSGIQPHRRLEIYDESVLNSGNGSHPPAAPQLRLTFTSHANVNNGIWTDFQTTNLGDLYIHPYGVISSTNATAINRNVGINDATPSNTLEITSSGNTTVSPRPAGLRFTNLTSASAIDISLSTANNKVLTVDGNGDVCLTNGGDGNIRSCAAGGISAGNINYITKITAANEICNSAIWENSTSDLSVGIGTTSPTAKFNVKVSTAGTSSSAIIGEFDYTNTNTSGSLYHAIGVYANTNVASGSYNDGFWSQPNGGLYCRGYAALVENTNTLSSVNMGYRAFMNVRSDPTSTQSTNEGYNAYVQVNADPGTSSSNSTNYCFIGGVGGAFANNNTGIYCTSSNASVVMAGRFEATLGSTINYGVYASGGTTCTTSPTITNCPDAAGFFSGDVGVTNSVFQSSDQFLKDNIQPITNSIGIINQLNPVSYNYKTQQYPSMHLSDGNHYGLIANDVKPILPDIVRGFSEPEVKDTLGNIVHPQIDFQAINYTALIPFLIAGMQELYQQINDLQTQINNCCGAPRPLAPSQCNNEKTRTIDVKLINGDNSSILYQNEPNPYHSATIIRYFIPENTSDVKITFQDATGKTLKEIPISETGQGSINVNGSELISGTYTYSLVIGSKILDVKKMVKMK